ncbi:SRR1-domain-containing protein [Phanerochaete sordida]|uniref:SRR1-domain-containing protein n=1 Tax=Phanerochaete sordida TaxID=48140 RepID=A0A9P3G2W2_9APHY|nr:SRR1-domain-containing protein [Phanerochaete sordida]
MTANMSSFEYEAPFTPSRPKKKRKSRMPQDRPDPAVGLSNTIEELASSGWVNECTQLVRDALRVLAMQKPRVLCLGLGSPSSSRDARTQLAFLLAACDDLTLERSTVSAYDPVFTDEDDRLLATAGVQRLTENRSAAYPLGEPTIVYMPHCDLPLYENIMRENSSRERLPRLLLIANRLSEYLDSLPSHKLQAEYPCVARLAPLLTSLPLPPCPSSVTAFNNLAVQFVPPETMTGVDAAAPNRPPSAAPAGSHDEAIITT